jgi:hypothetical protein
MDKHLKEIADSGAVIALNAHYAKLIREAEETKAVLESIGGWKKRGRPRKADSNGAGVALKLRLDERNKPTGMEVVSHQPKPKRHISAEGRQALRAAARLRWEKFRAAKRKGPGTQASRKARAQTA